METQKSQFNRILLIILVILYLLSIAAFTYLNWAADPEFVQWWMVVLNILILSIPLVLLYGSIYVLVVAWREHASTGQVSPPLAKVIHWAPRIGVILIIFFMSLFSLDVFEMQAPPLELLGGFLMHNIPSILLLIVLIFAWKRPGVGFVAFLALAILLAFRFVRSIDSLPNMLFFVIPVLLVSFLFYIEWKWVKPQTHSQINAAI